MFNKKAYIVDRNSINRKILGMHLSKAGYASDSYIDGDDLSKEIKFGNYQLVLIDSGESELIKSLIDADLLKNLPNAYFVIVVNSLSEKDEYLSLGFSYCICKPVSFKAIDDLLKVVFNNEMTENSEDDNFIEKSIEKLVIDFGISDIQMLSALFKEFFSFCQKDIEKLYLAVANSNIKEIKETAHSIKGASRNLRLDCIGSLAEKIEHKAKQNEETNYNELLEELNSVFVRLNCSFKNKYDKGD